ncbi:hypothetical protein BKA69DRAFT_1128027 [Paraphysoderma sedebokerense]|nr:hypothetical protein BKA69DRAFT_1128027 [Paraphysoderma sedebokerense]
MKLSDVRERLSKIESVVDLCDFCNSSPAECDQLFRTDFPKRLQLPPELPEFGGLEQQSPLTTTEACKFSKIHEDLRRYRFKYYDMIPSDTLDPFPKHPFKLIHQHVLETQKHVQATNAKDNGMSQKKQLSSQVIEQSTVLAWSHPNILALLKVFYTQIFKHVGLLFDRAFSPMLHFQLGISSLMFDLSWDGVLARMDNLKTIHHTMEFKRVLNQIAFFVGDRETLYMNKGSIFGSTVLLLYKYLPEKYHDTFWYGYKEKDVAIDAVVEW